MILGIYRLKLLKLGATLLSNEGYFRYNSRLPLVWKVTVG
jgi:hypothetical protein